MDAKDMFIWEAIAGQRQRMAILKRFPAANIIVKTADSIM